MQVMGLSDFRKNLASALDYVEESHAPVLVTRSGGSSAVVMSLDDYNAHQETMYLLSNPYNAAHLMRAVTAVENSKLVQREMIETDSAEQGLTEK